MTIDAHNPTGARKQRVRTPRLVIIEFVLDQLPHVGTTGQLLHLSLAQNYLMSPDKFHHELIFFEIGDQTALEKHAKYMSRIVGQLQRRCALWHSFFPSDLTIQRRNFDHTVVIIHTHSDDTTGDLWLCSYDVKLKGPAAIQIGVVRIFFFTPDCSDDFPSFLMPLLAQTW